MKSGIVFCACLLAVAGGLAAGPAAAGSNDLVGLMNRMQIYAHKLQLSVAEKNGPLAHFYLHELEETSQTVVEEIDSYGDKPIGRLVKDMLLPAIERVEATLESDDWAGMERRFAELLHACNACHQVTGHGFIRIAPASGNPFAQDFSRPGD